MMLLLFILKCECIILIYEKRTVTLDSTGLPQPNKLMHLAFNLDACPLMPASMKKVDEERMSDDCSSGEVQINCLNRYEEGVT